MKKQYTIETVLTSHGESCTAYLLIEKRTGPIGTGQKILSSFMTNSHISRIGRVLQPVQYFTIVH